MWNKKNKKEEIIAKKKAHYMKEWIWDKGVVSKKEDMFIRIWMLNNCQNYESVKE